VLRNPKYTGYNVWGRHDKRRGRPFIRPCEQCVWSPTRVHEPLVPGALFELVEERARRNQIQAKHPRTDFVDLQPELRVAIDSGLRLALAL